MNTLAPNSAATQRQPLARPTVGMGTNAPPYNTRMVFPDEPNADSATTDVYTGIASIGKEMLLRERAVYDLNALSFAPLASTGTGVLFPDAVRAKVEVETSLRERPTNFRGRKQLDVSEEDGEVHLNRQMHPNGTNKSDQTWHKQKGDLPFVGYPNPDLFYAYMEAIPTHNVQNLSHAQLTDALRVSSGAFDHNDYLNRVGALMHSGAVTSGASASEAHVVQSNGGGVNSDPRLLERIAEEYERDFQKAHRIQVADATADARYGESAPGIFYIEQQQQRMLERETQFNKVQADWGIGSSYTAPAIQRIG
jgi:hypothetical protein